MKKNGEHDESPKPKSVTVHISMPADTAKKLEQYAEENEMTLSYAARCLMRQGGLK
jgi:hypothetical protein